MMGIGNGGCKEKSPLEINNQGTWKLFPQCSDRVFVGYGRTFREAKAISESKCHKAGCHTPGGIPYNCCCGHSTPYMLPN